MSIWSEIGRRQFLAGSVSALAAKSLFALDSGSSLATDRHRPQYHLMPPANWLNDPNGPLFWKGKYHMFYQYSPTIFPLGLKYWGHAVSTDMVHWKNLGIALAPTPDGTDAKGCWTGSAVIHNGIPTLVYTGAWFTEPTEPAARQKGLVPERQMVAVADDPNDPNLLKWNKIPENPVIAAPPPGLKVAGWRDPSLWKEGDTWFMVIGSGEQGVGGMALMYHSSDLRHWEYMHPLANAKPAPPPPAGTVSPGSSMWECPDFFFLDNKPVLMVARGNSYLTGTYRDYRFEQAVEGSVDYGSSAYAQKTMADATGRRIWWGWLHEARSTQAQAAAGWAGVMSLPRILTLQANGELGVEPASEVKTLRGRSHKIKSQPIKPDGPLLLQQLSGDCVEILADFDLGNAKQVGLRVRSTADGSEQTLVGYDRETSTIFCDTMQSSSDPETLNANRPLSGRSIQKGTLLLKPGENLRLQVFVDASVIEIFANGRAALTDRVYPTNPESLGIGLFARGGEAKLGSLEAYDLTPISTDRLTSGKDLFRV
jgi:beta-fructofuranosidase